MPTFPSWIRAGVYANEWFGTDVASAGDVNGDGFSDVIVGAERFSNAPGVANGGAAFVHLGASSGISNAAPWAAYGTQVGGYFGGRVAAAGDVNGDGYDDVIIGERNFGPSGEGRCVLYLGSASGLPSMPAWAAMGTQANAAFGNAIAGVGDVNGDGFDDVLVGAFHHSNGHTFEGSASLFLGSATGLAASPAWTAEGNENAALFGTSLDGAGDVNGDGYADFVVASRFNSAGRISFYFGGPSGPPAVANLAYTSLVTGFATLVSSAGDVNGDGYSDVLVTTSTSGTSATVELFTGSPSGPTSPTWSSSGTGGFGRGAASAGDVNGDGYADVIIGDPTFTNGQMGEGQARVYLGSSQGLGAVPAWTGESDQALAGYGNSVASAGDVNGDGFSDVIVGASNYDVTLPFITPDVGAAYVYMGSGQAPSNAVGWMTESNQNNAQLGHAVASAGDVNGDGYSDILVSAHLFDNGQTNEGQASLYLGSPSGLTAGWTAESNDPNSEFSRALAGAGDVNGDGFDDVVVGAAAFGPTDRGKVWLYLGSPSGTLIGGWSMEGVDDNWRFGGSVAGAGDVDGDGFADVIVGASGAPGGGRAFLFRGTPTGLEAAWTWTDGGFQPGASYGSSVASAGDVNGDGYSDVLVSAIDHNEGQSDEGKVYLYLGSPSGLEPTPAWTFQSNNAGARLNSIAGAGDVNGDGLSDVILGAYHYSTSSVTQAGRVWVFLGTASGQGLSTTPNFVTSGSQQQHKIGASVAHAGDLNRDGYSDVIVGSWSHDASAGADAGKVWVYFGGPAGTSSINPWTVTSGQGGAFFGVSVASAGDVDGDGFGDLLVGATKAGSNDEGRAFLFHGNDGSGLARIPQQLRTNGGAPIALLGISNDPNQARLRALGRTPAGRGRVAVEFEMKPHAIPFDGLGLVKSALIDSGPPSPALGSSVAIEQLLSGLIADETHHWRLRLVSENPRFPRSPWISLPGNAITEAKFRTKSTAPQSASAIPFGSGCAGATGVIPTLTATAAPVLGGPPFQIVISHPTVPAGLVLLGAHAAIEPLNIGGGCLWYPGLAPVALLQLTLIGGTTALPIALPNDPALLGAPIYLQAAVLNTSGFALTRGLKLTLGY